MNEILTIKEIEEKFDFGWVLIGDVQTNERYEVLGGRVFYHSGSREELYEKAKEMNLKRIAVRYVGERPKDIVLFL